MQQSLKPPALQPAVAADRFAREIVRILTDFAVRSRQLNGNPFGGTTNAFAPHRHWGVRQSLAFDTCESARSGVASAEQS